jgi:hypothetical protein
MRAWTQKFMEIQNVIKFNYDIGSYFQSKKGVRQGEPLSSMLCNIMVDMLAIPMNKKKE